jgi:hypothetical protein
MTCAADTQFIVDFTFLPSGEFPPRLAGSYVQCTSTTFPSASFTTLCAMTKYALRSRTSLPGDSR